MDPEAALDTLVRAFRRIRSEELDADDSYDLLREIEERGSALIGWLAGGGFAPDWKSAIRRIEAPDS